MRLRLDCRYELTLLWEDDAAKRGIVHGRQGVYSKGKSAKQLGLDCRQKHQHLQKRRPHDTQVQILDFVNFESQDFEEEPILARWSGEGYDAHTLPARTADSMMVDNETSTSMSRNNLDEIQSYCGVEEVNTEEDTLSTQDTTAWPVSYEISSVSASALSSIEAQLMGYYVHALAPQCSLRTDLNPYLEVLLPVANDFAPLRHMLLAASACQLFHYSKEIQYEIHSLRHRSKALRGLNDHLRQDKMDWKSLATMAMFCFRDITDGSDASWLTHLQMGLRMLRQLNCVTNEQSELKSFCEIYFVAHEVMGRTGWDHDIDEIDVYQWMQDEKYREVGVTPGYIKDNMLKS